MSKEADTTDPPAFEDDLSDIEAPPLEDGSDAPPPSLSDLDESLDDSFGPPDSLDESVGPPDSLDESMEPPEPSEEDFTRWAKEESSAPPLPLVRSVPVALLQEQLNLFDPVKMKKALGEVAPKVAMVSFGEDEAKQLLAYLESANEADAIATKITNAIQKEFKGKSVRVSLPEFSNFTPPDELRPRTQDLAKSFMTKNTPSFNKTKNDMTADVRSIVTAWIQAEQVKNGAEALEAIASNEFNSRRLRQVLAIEDKEERAALFPLQLLLQETVPVSLPYLFRGFVCNGQLTGISQLFAALRCEEHTNEFLAEISGTITKMFAQKVQKFVGLNHYVFDFSIGETKITVFRVLPFVQSTDSLLFGWRRDAEVLQLGPCQIRIRQKQSKEPYALLPTKWRQWACEHRGYRDPLGPPEEAFMFKAFRWVTLALIVMMTAFSFYMFMTTDDKSGRRGRRR